MALLQAARAHELGLPLDSAYSWGLNRAIFYAAAKRGFKGGGTKTIGGEHVGGPRKPSTDTYYLGDEMAYKSEEPGELRFSIGGKAQTPEDFQRQIGARFGGKFKEAWEEAVDYVGRFPRETLESGTEFFSSVYRPKRDEFAAKWTEMSGAEAAVRLSQSARTPRPGRKRSSGARSRGPSGPSRS